MNTEPVRKRILAANDEAARANRERFAASGTLVANLISSPGSGKTTLLSATAERLHHRIRAAAIVGDVATELDAERLRVAGLRAHQIVTGGACHLDARMLAEALPWSGWPAVDLLFVENVGNLVCPSSYDLGEDFKVALVSTTEGHDKPFKYPAIFSRADVTLVTKIDLLPHVDFDLETVRGQVATLNRRARVLEVSARTGEGLEAWCGLLTARLEAKQRAEAVPT